jgi:hypothetical protein
MLITGADCTVNVVLPDTEPLVAVMVVEPAATAEASPAALIVATAVLEDAHVTCVVMFCVVLSEYVPVAVNCCVAPAWMLGFAGVTAIDVSVAAGAELKTTSTQ